MDYLNTFQIIYIYFLAALLGLVFGSFCNAWAWRLVSGEKITRGRSHCVSCGHVLAAKDLVPLFSYLFLRGRCRYCGEKISARYPVTELVSCLYYVSVFAVHGLSLTTLRLVIAGSLMLTASLVDIDTMELPDGLMAALAACSLIRLAEDPSSWKDMFCGLIPAAVLLGVVLLMDRILKKESMGGGDIKFLAALGLHFGPAQTVLLLIVSCIFGLAAAKFSGKDRETPFPFGPSIAAAAWFTALAGEALTQLYFSLF